jgi:hypothetical protein
MAIAQRVRSRVDGSRRSMAAAGRRSLAPGTAAAWLLYCQIVGTASSGVWPTITKPDGAYRSYARQLWWWVRRYVLAGRGRVSGDVEPRPGDGVDNFNWASIPAWVREYAAARAGFAFDTPSEHWHMRYLGAPRYTTSTTSGIGSVLLTEEDFDMWTYTEDGGKTFRIASSAGWDKLLIDPATGRPMTSAQVVELNLFIRRDKKYFASVRASGKVTPAAAVLIRAAFASPAA